LDSHFSENNVNRNIHTYKTAFPQHKTSGKQNEEHHKNTLNSIVEWHSCGSKIKQWVKGGIEHDGYRKSCHSNFS
jgi:hypothetical protein